MSQPQHFQQVIVQQAQSNGLGTAGFIVSLISFFCCGFTAPVGLFMSMLALLWAPRGMALGGVILGVLGSWWLFAGGLALAGSVAAMIGLANAPLPTPEVAAPEVMESPAEPVADAVAQPVQPEPIILGPTIADPTPVPVPADLVAPATPAEVAPTANPKLRTWTSGNFSTEAEFLSIAYGQVKLRKSDGKEITIAREKLSAEDQRWLDDYIKSKR